MRRGWRTAWSPPGSIQVRRWAARFAAGRGHAQEFAAPDGAVVAEPGAVPRHAEHRSVQVMLRHAREDMGVMMLHADDRQAGLFGEPRRVIVGMPIARHHGGRPREKCGQIGGGPAESVEGERRLQVADVLAQADLVVHGERHGVLQMPANREDGPQRLLDEHRQRRITARAAQHHLAVEHNADDRIIDVPHDRPIVHQEAAGDTGEPGQGFALVDADGLVGAVAAGRHDGKAKLREQQMMQRRVGKHDAEVGIAGGDDAMRRRRGGLRRRARSATRCSEHALPRGPTPYIRAGPRPHPPSSARTASRRGACAAAAGRRRRDRGRRPSGGSRRSP